MKTTMRAKLIISSVTQTEGGGEQLQFRGVCKNEGYGTDGLDENNTFAKFSPSVDLKMYVANPALQGKFAPGDTFYVDFTDANHPEPEEVKVTPEVLSVIAGQMYTAYCEAVGGVAFNGDALPNWDDFASDPAKSKQSKAWIAAARTTIG